MFKNELIILFKIYISLMKKISPMTVNETHLCIQLKINNLLLKYSLERLRCYDTSDSTQISSYC